MTKGELCREVEEDLDMLARCSMSCDETERGKSDLTHCGICTSCLLRRVSLHRSLGRSGTLRLSRQEAQDQIFALVQRHAAEALSFYEHERPQSLPKRSTLLRRSGEQSCLPLSN
jgi:hypothetical protein